jgi:hypothetical protein
MSTGAIIGIIIAVIVVVAVAVVASAGMRRARLRRQFGPEYDRLVEKHGKKKAEAELTERERRVKALNIRDLSPEQQASYSGDWTVIQERFVDAPAEAVGAAHTLIWNVMRDRGYPAEDRTTSMDALAVHHSRAMEGYRDVHDMQIDSASTEQLREAMIRYRAMFEDLTGMRNDHAGSDRVAEIQARSADNNVATADDRVAGDRVADERAVAEDRVAEERAAQQNSRTADTPR